MSYSPATQMTWSGAEAGASTPVPYPACEGLGHAPQVIFRGLALSSSLANRGSQHSPFASSSLCVCVYFSCRELRKEPGHDGRSVLVARIKTDLICTGREPALLLCCRSVQWQRRRRWTQTWHGSECHEAGSLFNLQCRCSATARLIFCECAAAAGSLGDPAQTRRSMHRGAPQQHLR
jgi:hypothetical protein